MFSDYLNTELFFPTTHWVIENRIEYKGNVHAQNRYSYFEIKLQTWKYKRGILDIN